MEYTQEFSPSHSPPQPPNVRQVSQNSFKAPLSHENITVFSEPSHHIAPIPNAPSSVRRAASPPGAQRAAPHASPEPAQSLLPRDEHAAPACPSSSSARLDVRVLQATVQVHGGPLPHVVGVVGVIGVELAVEGPTGARPPRPPGQRDEVEEPRRVQAARGAPPDLDNPNNLPLPPRFSLRDTC